jgi:hypothetical protein
MSRKLKRVPLDFDAPLNVVWQGYVAPANLDDEGIDAWWENGRTDPPTGEGYQVWETVSQGSPISPVFATEEAVAAWLVQQGNSEDGAREFVRLGWAPSMALIGGRHFKGIDSLEFLNGGEEDSDDEWAAPPY